MSRSSSRGRLPPNNYPPQSKIDTNVVPQPIKYENMENNPPLIDLNHSPNHIPRSDSRKRSGSRSMKKSRTPSVEKRPSRSRRSRTRSKTPRRSRSRSYPSRSRSRSRKRSSRSRSRRRSRSSRSYTRSRSPYRDGPKKFRQSNAPPSKILAVFGLSVSTKENDLYDVFSKYGQIEHVELIFDRRTGESKRFGFVYMNSEDEAKKAKEELSGLLLNGEHIRVDFSQTKKPHDPTPGQYMGKVSRSRYKSRHPYNSYRRSPNRDYRYDSGYYRRSDSSYDRYYDDRYYDDYDRSYRRR